MDEKYYRRQVQSKTIALISSVLLIGLFFVWNTWFDQRQAFSREIEVFLLSIPAVISAIGIIRDKSSSFLLAGLLSLIYFMLGVWYVANPEERIYGLAMIICSFSLFIASYFYLKFQGKIAKSLEKSE